jgi:hypothetical protein
MEQHGRRVRWQADNYMRFCLGAIVVLMTVLIVGLWAERVPVAGPAGAAERYQPRSSLDIEAQLQAQERTVEKLEEIRKLLESGDAKVQVVGGESKEGGGENHVQPTSDANETGGIQQGIHAN